jgi:hypothetical protein
VRFLCGRPAIVIHLRGQRRPKKRVKRSSIDSLGGTAAPRAGLAAKPAGGSDGRLDYIEIASTSGQRARLRCEELVDLRRRLVITAAHCLPAIPALRGERENWSETFRDLIGPLGAKASVWTECLSVDPIADIAVLGPPDNQSLPEQADACETFLASRKPLKVGGAIEWDMPTPATLIALDGHLIDCAVRPFGGPLWIENLAEPIAGGMSGSP